MSERYRKKPVVIEAEQFTEEMALACLLGEREAPFGLHVTGHWHPEQRKVYSAYIYIRTLEGTMRAEFGDWIIRGVKGELYPCKPDIFTATYDPDSTTNQPPPDGMKGEK